MFFLYQVVCCCQIGLIFKKQVLIDETFVRLAFCQNFCHFSFKSVKHTQSDSVIGEKKMRIVWKKGKHWKAENNRWRLNKVANRVPLLILKHKQT